MERYIDNIIYKIERDINTYEKEIKEHNDNINYTQYQIQCLEDQIMKHKNYIKGTQKDINAVLKLKEEAEELLKSMLELKERTSR